MTTLITNVGQLVTPIGREPLCGGRMRAVTVAEGAELVAHGGRIASVGGGRSSVGITEAIDAEGGVVLPGLVNPHTHAVLPLVHLSARGSDVGPHPQNVPEEGISKRMRKALDRLLQAGTTTLEVKCGREAGEISEIDLLALLQHVGRSSPLRVVPTLLGTVSPSKFRQRADEVSSLIREVIPTVRRRRLAQFCDVVCGDGAYTEDEARTILRAARGAGLRVKLHIQEQDTVGFGRIGAVLEVTSADHLTSASDDVLLEMNRAGVVPVLLPGLSFLCGRSYPEARRMIDGGLPVALGSDFALAGYGVESMWTVLSLAVARMGMTVEEGITAMTLNAAAAVELADEVGTLEPGKHADLIILDVDDYREIPHCVGRNPVSVVVIGGQVVHRA
jgi:imidazolonepropionase